MTKKDYNKKYEDAASRAESGELNKITLEKGDNIVRIIDLDFEENIVCYVEDTEGKTKKINMTVDPKENAKRYKALFDAIPDVKKQHRYYFKALQGKKEKGKDGAVKVVLDPTVRLLEVGPAVFKQISAIQLDNEFPDITEINLKITKKGEKLKTEYQVLPNPKSTKLPELEGDIDLSKFVELTDAKTLNNILGNDYDADEEETDEEETDETTDEAVDSDKFDDMNRDELKKFIKKEKLEVTVTKSMSDDDIREKIRELVNKEDEPEETDEDDLDDLDDLDED